MGIVDSFDEILALIMGLAGVGILLFVTYMSTIGSVALEVDNLLLIVATLLGPSTGYLFGKSIPKQEKLEKQ